MRSITNTSIRRKQYDENKNDEQLQIRRAKQFKSSNMNKNITQASAFEKIFLTRAPAIATLSSFLPTGLEYPYISQLSTAASQFEQTRLIQNNGVYIINPNPDKCLLASRKFPHATCITFDIIMKLPAFSSRYDSIQDRVIYFEQNMFTLLQNLCLSLKHLHTYFSNLKELFVQDNFLGTIAYQKQFREFKKIFEEIAKFPVWQNLNYLSFKSVSPNLVYKNRYEELIGDIRKTQYGSFDIVPKINHSLSTIFAFIPRNNYMYMLFPLHGLSIYLNRIRGDDPFQYTLKSSTYRDTMMSFSFTSFFTSFLQLSLPPNAKYLKLRMFPFEEEIVTESIPQEIILEEVFFDYSKIFWQQFAYIGYALNAPENLKTFIYSGPENLFHSETKSANEEEDDIGKLWSKLKSVQYAQLDHVFTTQRHTSIYSYIRIFHSLSNVHYLSLKFLFNYPTKIQVNPLELFPMFPHLKYLRILITPSNSDIINNPDIFNVIFPSVKNLTVLNINVLSRQEKIFDSLPPEEFKQMLRDTERFLIKHESTPNDNFSPTTQNFIKFLEETTTRDKRYRQFLMRQNSKIENVWIETEIIIFHNDIDYRLKIGQTDPIFKNYLNQYYPIEQQNQCVSTEIVR